VSILVVDPLEAVQVEEDDRERDAVALAALDLPAQIEVQVARVEELGQIVGDGELLGALEENRVLQSDRARLDQGQHEIEVGAGEPPLTLVDDLEDADCPPPRDEGRAQDRAGGELGPPVVAVGEPGIPAGVVHDGGLALSGHPTRHPLAHLEAVGGDGPAPGAEGGLEDELLLFLVDHQERPGLGWDELADLLHDQLDHLARLEDGVGGLDHVGQDRQPLRGRLERLPNRGGAVRAPTAGTLEMGMNGAGGRVAGAPDLEDEVEAEPSRPPQGRGVGRDRHPADGLAGQGLAHDLDCPRLGVGPGLDERPGQGLGREIEAGPRSGERQELVLESRPRGTPEPASQRRTAKHNHARQDVLSWKPR
jgi:hypothetical protein